MRLLICHLSDIHFSDNNSIILKRDKICSAILSKAFRNEKILFLISGDIANWGREVEYAIAIDFFSDLMGCLEKEKNIKTYFFFVPGNHDCDFSNKDFLKDEELRREKILRERDGLLKEDLQHYVKKMLEKQNNYTEFLEAFRHGNDDIDIIEDNDGLCNIYELKINCMTVKISTINTAWLSQIHEKPGANFIPSSMYQKISKKEGVNITMFHHPSNWMEPNNKNEFDRWIEKESDIILVGHEHIGRNEYIENRETSYATQYGEVLQDRNDADSSGFIVNYIDGQEFGFFSFKWNEVSKIYECVAEEIKNLNDINLKRIRFTSEYLHYLDSFDMQITHPNKKEISLKDIFIYPDLEVYSKAKDIGEQTKEITTIKGEQLLECILEKKKVVFSGKAKTGKTALCKAIALDMDKRNISSIIIDCKKLKGFTEKHIKEMEENEINRAYGKNVAEDYKQLSINRKMIILDNIDRINQKSLKEEMLKYFENFYGYVVSVSNTMYELDLLGNTLNNNQSDYFLCGICELGHRKRNGLIKKWYMLSEGENIFVEEELKEKINKATEILNILKGNGYMPCIPSHILIVLQQLDYTVDRKEDRSSYGYMYEFLIDKALLQMDRNNKLIHQDIALGVLTNVAKYMLENKKRIVTLEEYKEIFRQYNAYYRTEENQSVYLEQYEKVELICYENEQIEFQYPYIHYYFTAKYLAQNIQEQSVKEQIDLMSRQLHFEESGDIMIFLCHLSKEKTIIESVLANAINLFEKDEEFDFEKYKSINISFDEFINTNIIPEEGIEERQEEILEKKDQFESQKKESKKTVEDSDNTGEESEENIKSLDTAFKSIEVMGQILKNYPGTIAGDLKEKLLTEIHNLGMRTLSHINEILSRGIERLFDEIKEQIKDEMPLNEGAIDTSAIMDEMKAVFEQLNVYRDNLFGLMVFTMLRRLANSLANEALKPLINNGIQEEVLSFELMRTSLYLNEFGIIQVDGIIKKYDDLLNEGNLFAAKLIRLMVFDHYYSFGSTNFKARQKIWSKMGFSKQQKTTTLLKQQ